MMQRSSFIGKSIDTRLRFKSRKPTAHKTPNFDEFIEKRDYTGALVYLDFHKKDTESNDVEKLLWIGYCAFHKGDYQRAQEVYIELLSNHNEEAPDEVTLYLACIYFYMQMFKEAEEAATAGPDCSLKNRVLQHTARRMNIDEQKKKLDSLNKHADTTAQDRLSHAALQYTRNYFQEATDIYKRLLIEDRDNLALNVYVAMCYFKLVNAFAESFSSCNKR
mmetsp:Transcript_25065/g.37122  ORF Transcript_25065/g.37122 Transcript_25065/m.37122 type:complete len:220 (-) Transcript_25065:1644-2303(-)